MVLTLEIKRQIEQYRTQGHGAKSIARLMDLNINTVKAYCRRNKQLERECPQCHQTFTQPVGRRQKRFCSPLCKSRWWSVHKDQLNTNPSHQYTCLTCGKEFTSYRNIVRKYCSQACYQASRTPTSDL